MNLDNPIPLEPKPARSADKLWLVSLTIMSPSPAEKARAVAVLAPYVSATGEVLRERAKTLVLEDLLTKAVVEVQLGAAMDTLLAEVDRQARAVQLFG